MLKYVSPQDKTLKLFLQSRPFPRMKFNNLFPLLFWHFISFPPVCHNLRDRAAFVLVYSLTIDEAKMMKFKGMERNHRNK